MWSALCQIECANFHWTVSRLGGGRYSRFPSPLASPVGTLRCVSMALWNPNDITLMEWWFVPFVIGVMGRVSLGAGNNCVIFSNVLLIESLSRCTVLSESAHLGRIHTRLTHDADPLSDWFKTTHYCWQAVRQTITCIRFANVSAHDDMHGVRLDSKALM